jgi:protein gp37
MSKTPRLSKTDIEYGGLAWNFYSGCLHGSDICAVNADCWAHSIVNRFPAHYPNGWKPTLYPEALLSPLSVKTPSVILCAFMGDLFGKWIDPERAVQVWGKGDSRWSLKKWVLDTIGRQCPQHTFLFLTKNPAGYIPWGEFPDNAWCGVSITNNYTYIGDMTRIKAKHKWLSIEPLLEWRDFPEQKKQLPFIFERLGIQWVVIGAQSGAHAKQPKRLWVDGIIKACNTLGIPYWLKDNLKPLIATEVVPINEVGQLHQECPFAPSTSGQVRENT